MLISILKVAKGPKLRSTNEELSFHVAQAPSQHSISVAICKACSHSSTLFLDWSWHFGAGGKSSRLSSPIHLLVGTQDSGFGCKSKIAISKMVLQPVDSKCLKSPYKLVSVDLHRFYSFATLVAMLQILSTSAFLQGCRGTNDLCCKVQQVTAESWACGTEILLHIGCIEMRSRVERRSWEWSKGLEKCTEERGWKCGVVQVAQGHDKFTS